MSMDPAVTCDPGPPISSSSHQTYNPTAHNRSGNTGTSFPVPVIQTSVNMDQDKENQEDKERDREIVQKKPEQCEPEEGEILSEDDEEQPDQMPVHHPQVPIPGSHSHSGPFNPMSNSSSPSPSSSSSNPYFSNHQHLHSMHHNNNGTNIVFDPRRPPPPMMGSTPMGGLNPMSQSGQPHSHHHMGVNMSGPASFYLPSSDLPMGIPTNAPMYASNTLNSNNPLSTMNNQPPTSYYPMGPLSMVGLPMVSAATAPPDPPLPPLQEENPLSNYQQHLQAKGVTRGRGGGPGAQGTRSLNKRGRDSPSSDSNSSSTFGETFHGKRARSHSHDEGSDEKSSKSDIVMRLLLLTQKIWTLPKNKNTKNLIDQLNRFTKSRDNNTLNLTEVKRFLNEHESFVEQMSTSGSPGRGGRGGRNARGGFHRNSITNNGNSNFSPIIGAPGSGGSEQLMDTDPSRANLTPEQRRIEREKRHKQKEEEEALAKAKSNKDHSSSSHSSSRDHHGHHGHISSSSHSHHHSHHRSSSSHRDDVTTTMSGHRERSNSRVRDESNLTPSTSISQETTTSTTTTSSTSVTIPSTSFSQPSESPSSSSQPMMTSTSHLEETSTSSSTTTPSITTTNSITMNAASDIDASSPKHSTSSMHRNTSSSSSPSPSTTQHRGSMDRDSTQKEGRKSDSSKDPSTSSSSSNREGKEKEKCKFFLEGKCHKGSDCQYSHSTVGPKKRELCKYYLQGYCTKGKACAFMHSEFPCKFFHTNTRCYSMENCRFSHGPLTEEDKDLLRGYLVSGMLPGDPPRESRDKKDHRDSHGDKGSSAPGSSINGSNNEPPTMNPMNLIDPPGGGGKGSILGIPELELKSGYETWRWQQEMRELETGYAGNKRNLFCIQKEFVINGKPDTPPPLDPDEEEIKGMYYYMAQHGGSSDVPFQAEFAPSKLSGTMDGSTVTVTTSSYILDPETGEEITGALGGDVRMFDPRLNRTEMASSSSSSSVNTSASSLVTSQSPTHIVPGFDPRNREIPSTDITTSSNPFGLSSSLFGDVDHRFPSSPSHSTSQVPVAIPPSPFMSGGVTTRSYYLDEDEEQPPLPIKESLPPPPPLTDPRLSRRVSEPPPLIPAPVVVDPRKVRKPSAPSQSPSHASSDAGIPYIDPRISSHSFHQIASSSPSSSGGSFSEPAPEAPQNEFWNSLFKSVEPSPSPPSRSNPRRGSASSYEDEPRSPTPPKSVSLVRKTVPYAPSRIQVNVIDYSQYVDEFLKNSRLQKDPRLLCRYKHLLKSPESTIRLKQPSQPTVSSPQASPSLSDTSSPDPKSPSPRTIETNTSPSAKTDSGQSISSEELLDLKITEAKSPDPVEKVPSPKVPLVTSCPSPTYEPPPCSPTYFPPLQYSAMPPSSHDDSMSHTGLSFGPEDLVLPTYDGRGEHPEQPVPSGSITTLDEESKLKLDEETATTTSSEQPNASPTYEPIPPSFPPANPSEGPSKKNWTDSDDDSDSEGKFNICEDE